MSTRCIDAHYQDDGFGPHGTPAALFVHPRGGEAKYLSGQMIQRRYEVMDRWANAVLRGRLAAVTGDMMMLIRDQVYLRAPREYDILRNSTALRLTSRREVIFDAPAFMPRLTQSQLDAIRKGSQGTNRPKTYIRRYK